MDFITGLLIFLVVVLLFLIALVVFTFVALGAVKAYRSRNSLKQIDVSDGIDETELQLIREALLKKKQIDAQAEAKAKLVAASAKIAEVAKS